MGLERESVAQLFFPFFFSRFNEAFLNLSSACRSIEGGGREDRVDPASTMDS